jgi:hypothetical protein
MKEQIKITKAEKHTSKAGKEYMKVTDIKGRELLAFDTSFFDKLVPETEVEAEVQEKQQEYQGQTQTSYFLNDPNKKRWGGSSKKYQAWDLALKYAMLREKKDITMDELEQAKELFETKL